MYYTLERGRARSYLGTVGLVYIVRFCRYVGSVVSLIFRFGKEGQIRYSEQLNMIRLPRILVTGYTSKESSSNLLFQVEVKSSALIEVKKKPPNDSCLFLA
jgi:hypothetical protein